MGGAQYVSYALTDTLAINGRAEVWADNQNFFVASFPGNLDYINAQYGNGATFLTSPKATTYSEFTVGLNYKPALPAPIAGLTLRPELRYDRALNGVRAYNSGKDYGSFTIAADAVLGF